MTDQQHNKNGEWLKDFIEFTMTALKKKPAATNCNNLTINPNAHIAKVVVVIQYLEEGLKKKLKTYQ
jgi:hypothetical protein